MGQAGRGDPRLNQTAGAGGLVSSLGGPRRKRCLELTVAA